MYIPVVCRQCWPLPRRTHCHIKCPSHLTGISPFVPLMGIYWILHVGALDGDQSILVLSLKLNEFILYLLLEPILIQHEYVLWYSLHATDTSLRSSQLKVSSYEHWNMCRLLLAQDTLASNVG